MFRFMSPLFLCLSALLALSCSVDSKSLPDCHPLFPECGDEDADGDGVVNRDDDFPTDASCSVRDQNNCTGCGRGCGEDEWCSESYTCRAVEDEVCNGEDEDGDGRIDEEIVEEAPLADNQVGVCEGALQSCVGGDWVSDYSGVSDYEEGVELSLSDGLDNNCNGDMDEDLRPCMPNCPDLDFVRIEGGSFMMGDPDPDSQAANPVHNVNVPTFEMMRTEITVAQYRACYNASVCSTPLTGEYYTWSLNPSDQEDHPINGVSWYQLMEFAAWVGARLPTEAEWEYAARGQGQDITYPWGDQGATCQYAVMNDGGHGCGESRTWPVCSKSVGNTTQGLCDMAGNVWEWVQDEWYGDYNGAPSDGSGRCSGNCPANASDSNYNASDLAGRVHRGGSWYGTASVLRAANRAFGVPSSQRDRLGGRLVRAIP